MADRIKPGGESPSVLELAAYLAKIEASDEDVQKFENSGIITNLVKWNTYNMGRKKDIVGFYCHLPRKAQKELINHVYSEEADKINPRTRENTKHLTVIHNVRGIVRRFEEITGKKLRE